MTLLATNAGRPAPLRSPARPTFLVGQDDAGRWVALDARGRAGGLFRSRHDAVRFACGEAGCRPDEIALAPGPVAFRL